MKYPPKKVHKKSFLDSIQPDFISATSSQKDEMTAIRQLRQASNSLVQELWEAGRDFDPTASFAEPIPQPFRDPVEELLRSKKKKPAFTFGFSSIGQEPSIVLRSADASPTLKSAFKKPKEVETSLSRQPERKMNLDRQHEAFKLKVHSENIQAMLNKEDAYYEELHRFRKLYSKDFIRDEQINVIPKKLESDPARQRIQEHHPLEETREGVPLHHPTEFYTTGYFKINDRLFPEPKEHLFKSPHDLEHMKFNNWRNLAQDVPPVKVSIPLSKITKTEKKYNPHTRLTYDPRDAADIGAYLYNGSQFHIGSRRSFSVQKLASLKQESRMYKSKFVK